MTSSDAYQRPDKTLQDKLTDEDVAQLLQDYKPVDDLFKVPVGSHLRYFTVRKDAAGVVKKMFRFGGLLQNKDNADKYVVLGNGKITWSVQTKTAIFYKKMSFEELKEEYSKQLEEKDELIDKLKRRLKKYVRRVEELQAASQKHTPAKA